MDAEPGKIAVEVLTILTRLEVAVGNSPVGDRPRDAVDELLDGVLALGGLDLAVEVLADDDVRRQLAPGGRDLAGRLLEEDLPILPLDRGRPQIPFGRVEGAGHVGGAEGGWNGERLPAGRPRILTLQVVGRRRRSGVRTVGGGGSGGRLEGCHRGAPWGKKERTTEKVYVRIVRMPGESGRCSRPGRGATGSTGPDVPAHAIRRKQLHLHAIARCCGNRWVNHFIWSLVDRGVIVA